MLEEVLNTRIMVKKACKTYCNDKVHLLIFAQIRMKIILMSFPVGFSFIKFQYLSRILHARQLILKLISNVTYGYSAANWSGRMPCVEVADAIVSKVIS